MSLELKIGNIEKAGSIESWRFILAKDDNTITFYAKAYPEDTSSFLCRGAVEENGIPHSSVIGGGGMSVICNILRLGDSSADYGIVPNSVMEKFVPLIAAYLRAIKTAEINMWYDPGISERNNPKHCEMWKQLGYEFDNRKRILELNPSQPQ